ncbi:MAG: NADP oxidoreductase [Candidatus Hydrogenedens sp.]|nr:NADP oxidoreductase [Candidatus Hydrogenedens sp.]
MSTLGTEARPLRVAIVGSGPSGFYAAQPLQKQDGLHVTIDMFDRLPAPFGLVRGGVAPDHPKIRSVTKVYDKIATAPGFTFWGNVKVGEDVSIETLRRHYDAIILAYGAETDRKLGIPGEDLPGSHTATSFVGWYNGHPDYRDLEFDLSQEAVAVIGLGNVAMDVARILAKTPDELRDTDIAQHALDALAESKVKTIYIIGRRGAAQSAFTTAEIKEMGHLTDCEPVVLQEEIELSPASVLEEEQDNNVRKNMEVLRELAGRTLSDAKSRRMHFKFLRSPVELKGGERLESMVLEKNKLEGGEPFKQKARGTGETEELPVGLVFRSIGYRGLAMPGVPFDEGSGRVPNDKGRVLENGAPVPGLYTAGWIKRGPSGIIGTNKPDSLETVQMLLEDLPNLTPCPEPEPVAMLAELAGKGVRIVKFEDWQKIDAVEIAKGEASGKPRERFTRIAEMLQVLED